MKTGIKWHQTNWGDTVNSVKRQLLILPKCLQKKLKSISQTGGTKEFAAVSLKNR